MPKKGPRFLVYEKISKQQVEDLIANKNPVDIRVLLAQYLDPVATVMQFALEEDDKIEEKAEIVLDYHVNNYEFTQSLKFNQKKTGTFLEIMHFIFNKWMEDRLPKEMAMVLFKAYCLRHSIQRPPHSLFVFNLNEVKAMTDYVQNTFLKFYLMYQYAIIPKLELELFHDKMFYWEAPKVQDIEDGAAVKPTEIPDLREYFSKEEIKQMTSPSPDEEEQEHA